MSREYDQYREMAIEEAKPICNSKWIDDRDVEHSCYLDAEHDGPHVCGLCDNNLHEEEEHGEEES